MQFFEVHACKQILPKCMRSLMHACVHAYAQMHACTFSCACRFVNVSLRRTHIDLSMHACRSLIIRMQQTHARTRAHACMHACIIARSRAGKKKKRKKKRLKKRMHACSCCFDSCCTQLHAHKPTRPSCMQKKRFKNKMQNSGSNPSPQQQNHGRHYPQ